MSVRVETPEKAESHSVCKNKEISAYLQKENTKIFIAGYFRVFLSFFLLYLPFCHLFTQRPIIQTVKGGRWWMTDQLSVTRFQDCPKTNSSG